VQVAPLMGEEEEEQAQVAPLAGEGEGEYPLTMAGVKQELKVGEVNACSFLFSKWISTCVRQRSKLPQLQ